MRLALCLALAATAAASPPRSDDAPSAWATRIAPDPAYKPLM
jgi:hypothetical protein